MSRLLGKLLYESGDFKFDSYFCFLKYVKSKDAFALNVRRSSGVAILSVKVNAELSKWIIRASDKNNEWLYRFSRGYKTKFKRGVNEVKELRSDELDWIAERVLCKDVGEGQGRKELVLSRLLEDDYSFDMFCVCVYFFNISERVLEEAKKQWKRKRWSRSDDSWFPVSRRTLDFGRKKGAKSKKKLELDSQFEETEEEFNARIAHNKKVAVMKGYLGWYLDACREECKRHNRKFDKKFYVSVWRLEREGVE